MFRKLIQLSLVALAIGICTPTTATSKCKQYDVTWYDTKDQVMSETTISDLEATLANPPPGSVSYRWIDQNDPNTENYYYMPEIVENVSY